MSRFIYHYAECHFAERRGARKLGKVPAWLDCMMDLLDLS